MNNSHTMSANNSRGYLSRSFPTHYSGGNLTVAPLSSNLSPSSKQPLLDFSRFTAESDTKSQSPCSCTRTAGVTGAAGGGTGSGSSGISIDGVHEMLASLALMCILSILMAFLALFFLQKTTPTITVSTEEDRSKTVGTGVTQSRIVLDAKEYMKVSQISVSLSTLTIALNLCCLFVSSIQFLSAVKLLKTPQGNKRTHEFLKKTSHVRITAIGAFLISIPVFFTGVILFTFINFDELPALATSIVIGIGIVFCGLASVQNVYLWQWEKTKATKEMSTSRLSQIKGMSTLPLPMELSTLV